MWEALVILVVVLVLFGARKLPELAKGLGQGIKEFKKATRDVTDDLHRAMEEDPVPARKLPANPDLHRPAYEQQPEQSGNPPNPA